jgi:hypothetical protein
MIGSGLGTTLQARSPAPARSRATIAPARTQSRTAPSRSPSRFSTGAESVVGCGPGLTSCSRTPGMEDVAGAAGRQRRALARERARSTARTRRPAYVVRASAARPMWSPAAGACEACTSPSAVACGAPASPGAPGVVVTTGSFGADVRGAPGLVVAVEGPVSAGDCVPGCTGATVAAGCAATGLGGAGGSGAAEVGTGWVSVGVGCASEEGVDAGGAAGAGGGLGALRGGSRPSGSTYVSFSPTRIPRWTYGAACSTSPEGPASASGSPSDTEAPLRTRSVPRWVSEAL